MKQERKYSAEYMKNIIQMDRDGKLGGIRPWDRKKIRQHIAFITRRSYWEILNA